ncbi:molybdopterin oxidoreductase family protein [Paenibacillus wulumuqiensis]|uniref:molybdopterin oxidoreductase family protein n=1 Tax=Paenibacillus wulumuqiensis TaxID=1567107 RepID=UPI000619F670|nr:molybdopterin oxidoreductase family protein [Paenibacillus wulumuqiensis]
MNMMQTQCPFCSVQCKISLHRTESGIMPAPPSAEMHSASRYSSWQAEGVPNAASQGRICVKGMNAHQHAMNRERLMFPLVRRNGALVRATWEEAMERIGSHFQTAIRQQGADSIGVYGGGSLTNETAYLLGKFARIGLGTRYIDYNGRFCMSAAASAGSKVFGLDRGMTCRLEDIPLARCIILAGTNIAECQPTLLPYFNQARANGAKIIVIDPRRTSTAAIADLHLQIRPGTDAMLALAMLKILVQEGWIDEEFIQQRTGGYEDLTTLLDGIETEDVAQLCGIPAEQIRQAASWYGLAETGIIFTARGVEQHTDGHLAVRYLINLVLATGKIGRPGCGYGAVTGQGNGQGGREHGQKADQLPGYRSIENAADREYIASVWQVDPADIPGKGVSAYEMMELAACRDIRTLFVMGSNPVVSNPNIPLVRSALEGLNMLIVADMFLSETARMADVVLPVTSYLENTGTLTNLEGRVLLREAALPAPGEARDDWRILCDLADRLGRGRHFLFQTAEEIFEELRIASRGGLADYYGITYERLRREEGIYWPCPSPEHQGVPMMFTEQFAHADGRASFTATPHHAVREQPSPVYPLILTNGRVLAHYLTGVQTRRSAALAARELENFVEVHPLTARQHHLQDGEWTEIQSAHGRFFVRCRISENIRPDTLFVPMHWGGTQNVNEATPPELDPYCKMPGFKLTAVTIRPVHVGAAQRQYQSMQC